MAAESTDRADGEGVDDPAELRARVELLEEENRRLREEYARARRATYRRTAVGMAAIGLLAVGGGLAFPGSRDLLFALGATGLFGAVLTYYLTPERFVAATVGEGVYGAVAANGASIVSELGLAGDRVYLPLDDPDRPAVLFVPQHPEYDLPDSDDLDATFVVTSDDRRRGVALSPTGAPLFAEFERTLDGPLADDPGVAIEQLIDGVVEEFELARSADPAVDVDGDRVAVAVSGSTLGAVDRFDHPIASFLGAGLARALDRPVSVEVHSGEGNADYLVACEWADRETSGSNGPPGDDPDGGAVPGGA